MFNSYLKQCIICLSIIANINALPNIVFIVADDLGWNDVGFHGSADIKTPNIDALAYSGIILNNYYVNPICTPSRSALMTGKYPIHTGMQHAVLYGAEARGLPLGEKLLPQYLKDLGYSTHIVGKWHLGFFKKKYTPTFRGFDSHLGFWTGHHDYFDHTAFEKNWYGFDMRRNLDVARDLHGQYSTDVFTAESVKILKNKKRGKPFFLYIAHTAVHSANEYNFLPCPDDAFKKFGHIPDLQRRKFAGMLSKLDDSVGEIVKTLNDKNLLTNTIIVFTTDNGGPAAGFNNNAASNYPLRGVKNTLWEGGLRGTAFLWSKLLKTAPRVSYQSMHIVDWLPTLLQAVNKNNKTYEREFQELDGISIWDALSKNKSSPRTKIFHNFDNIGEYNAASVSAGDWKLLRGTNYKGQWDSWYGPSGRNFTYDYKAIEQSLVGKIMKNYKYDLSPENIKRIRNAAEVKCGEFHQSPRPCLPMEKPCLFNLVDDPCEQNNLAYLYPEKVKELNLILNVYKYSALPPSNLPEDPRSNPKFWNYTWNNFGDYM